MRERTSYSMRRVERIEFFACALQMHFDSPLTDLQDCRCIAGRLALRRPF